MEFTGSRKAALLLTCLDANTAAELLRAARPEVVTAIATELVNLEAADPRSPAAPHELAQDFVSFLHKPKESGPDTNTFVRQVLASVVGQDRAAEFLGQARRGVDRRDPFRPIRDASPEELISVLGQEHPQVVALVLMELPPKKSAAVVPLLDEPIRREAVRRMVSGENVPDEAKARVAAIIRERLDALRKKGTDAWTGEQPVAQPAAAKPKAKGGARLRQVAMLLRNLATEMRDGLLKAIAEEDPDSGTAVQNLMVSWDDLPLIADRNVQDVLRNVEGRALALALVGAPPAVDAKIRGNISDRARAMIDEEMQLMKKPKADEIEQARETILGYLRQLNASGELQFEET